MRSLVLSPTQFGPGRAGLYAGSGTQPTLTTVACCALLCALPCALLCALFPFAVGCVFELFTARATTVDLAKRPNVDADDDSHPIGALPHAENVLCALEREGLPLQLTTQPSQCNVSA